MNVHVNQHSGNSPSNKTGQSSQLSKKLVYRLIWAKFLSDKQVICIKCVYLCSIYVAYAVMRACLICSASAFCSALSCLYMAKAPPRDLNGRTCAKLTHKFHIFNPLDSTTKPLSRSTTKLGNQPDVKHFALHCQKSF